MGGVVTRERRQPSLRKSMSPPAAELPTQEPRKTRTPPKADTARAEPQKQPHTKRAPESDQDYLTEEMIEDLTRVNTDNNYGKDRKKEAMDNWLLRAQHDIPAERDAVMRHKRSMEALAALPLARRERSGSQRVEHGRSSSRSKGSRQRVPPTVEIRKGVSAAA